MGIKSKRDAMASITARHRNVQGKQYVIYDAYLGTNEITKKPERLYSSDRKELERLIAKFYEERAVSGDMSTILTPDQIFDARTALRAIADAGMVISLTECAKREIERFSASSVKAKTLGEAYDEYFSSKESTDSEAELHKTRFTTGRWVDLTGRDTTTDSVSVESLTEYMLTQYGDKAPKTFNANIRYIGTFLNWCVSKHYMADNYMREVKVKPEPWRRPKFMSPEDVASLFALISRKEVVQQHPEYLALAITQFFAGVRRQEALRIAANPDAATIHLDDETLRVDAVKGATRGRTARTAHIEPNAIAWMKSFDYLGALEKICDSTTRMMYAFARRNKIKVFNNCARHTFITMHVAKYHTPEVTQSFVGTSGTMRARNYDGLATQKQGEAYFAIFPTSRVEPCACSPDQSPSADTSI